MALVEVLEFSDAYANRLEDVLFGVKIAFLSKKDLITNKRSVGRTQDLADIERLEGAEPD